jgi:hypothetical protein
MSAAVAELGTRRDSKHGADPELGKAHRQRKAHGHIIADDRDSRGNGHDGYTQAIVPMPETLFCTHPDDESERSSTTDGEAETSHRVLEGPTTNSQIDGKAACIVELGPGGQNPKHILVVGKPVTNG